MDNLVMFLVFLAFFFIYFFYIRTKNKGNVIRLLKKKEPTALINVFSKELKRIKNKNVREAFTAYNTVLVLILYGRLNEAKSTISRMEWANSEPLCQALNFSAQSLIYYFEGNIVEGLAMARKARAVQSYSTPIQGVRVDENVLNAYVDIGELLYGQNSNEKISKLRTVFRGFPIIVQLFVAWALMKGYHEINNMEKYEEMKQFCMKNAPNFLLQIEDNKSTRQTLKSYV
ncbi:hypothetical protein GE107_16655 [Cohnella sp. CFH 77786]|uniref:hypothetical protein n=1 Tax=Cohnella sp. CFH 77786 TaxID=2662265 RepID=UPI001C60AF3C|nr:hypothetical protein [Cohnella sp. CFH 77786]MBW5447686.1 hypothetical protein [Cohnella sp. CFH 77786]